jgi:hypothetical protein
MYPSLIACRSRATSTSASHHNSEKITNELKSHQETIDKLVTSKNSAEPQQQQLVDMQSAMTESLAMANSELNNQCERLQSTVKEFWDPQLPTTRRHSWWGKPGWSPNLGPRLVPQMLLSKSSMLITTIETQLASLQKDKESLSNQVVKFELASNSNRMLLVLAKRLTKSQHMLINAMKNEHAAEMATLKDEHTELADINHNLNDELNTAKHQNERFEQLITKNTSRLSIIWRTSCCPSRRPNAKKIWTKSVTTTKR